MNTKKPSFQYWIFPSLFFFIAAPLAGYFFNSLVKPNHNDDVPELRQCPKYCNDLPNRHFFSDDINVFAKDDQGKPFFLQLSLNRKQLQDGTYIHYYMSDLKYDVFSINKNIDFLLNSSEIPSKDFFSFYKNTMFSDLSTREIYDFTMTSDNQKIDAHFTDLNGDFIVRNTPEYTKYISLGDADIRFNGKNLKGHVFISKIYSSDYSKYIFFDGYDKIALRTHFLMLWDNAGNFYLVDSTKTQNAMYNYKSHTWVLYKDKKENFMKKAFDAKIDFIQKESKPVSWNIQISDIDNIQLSLNPYALFINNEEGILKGNVIRLGEISDVYGFFHYVAHD